MINEEVSRGKAACATPDRRLERRRAMIEAAESLFLEQGYDTTSLAAIVKRSGGSLATLYELFGNKQGLLRAMIELRDEQDRCPGYGEDCATKKPSELLRGYAHRLYAHVTSKRAIALKRIVITEALRDPDFARTLYEDIHLPSVRELADILRALDEQGKANIDDPMAAAGLFFAIVMSDAQMRALVEGDDGLLDPAALDWRLKPFLSYFEID
ncbi:TetR/AcrR family transcriptional regulator [Sphingomonas sp. LY160]|jgi:AcrR family transcriptional regulator|uniref:TetR/AcrR family transcriptional regulator n=1 Tax=Sphingomonas sp. LY160 TaxID=3095342 RepID=UPI002ADED37A|nr:TetR/AcrR family transcriptional regulator [Sphingomonas sp. LY160]MEA1071806.1 TetR/AcrR family transcriptional regulator [Sphingomonas sp. LY160]